MLLQDLCLNLTTKSLYMYSATFPIISHIVKYSIKHLVATLCQVLKSETISKAKQTPNKTENVLFHEQIKGISRGDLQI